MPLVNVTLRQGTTPDYRTAVAEGIHRAMVEALEIPEDDRFELIHEQAPENMLHDPVFFGVERSDQSVFIQIFVNVRPLEQKQALYRSIVENLTREPGVRKEDIFIGVVEVAPENWWADARHVDERTGLDARTGPQSHPTTSTT
jgi:phenylpyruvate tautomerase PptA (4-oxalocrotonate tautomerase family)